jgi:NADPH-dependent glutamate synthase beta subunit-like oxidoreductase
VTDGLAFLRQAKANQAQVPQGVTVLGGGNTAMDAACTAKRLGARDVYVVYRRSFKEMPAWPADRDAAMEAGVHFLTLTQPLEYVTRGGRLTGLKVARTVLGEADPSGRRSPHVLPDSEAVLPTGLVIEALGQEGMEGLADLLPGVEMTPHGLVRVDPEGQATSRQGVYAGGDIANGGATAVQAVAEGMSAAAAIEQYLRRALSTSPQ